MLVLLGLAACAPAPRAQDARPSRAAAERVRPGVTVLMEDSLALLAGKRVAVLTNQTGADAEGRSVVDLLHGDPRGKRANITVVRLFSPEHGIRGTADRPDLPDEVDARSGLTVHSLYARETIPPPDSLLRDLDALVFDLQDIGTRTWTYVGVMVYAMRAAARVGIPFVVLDRPNPITGRVEGPLLDAALANPEDPTPERRGKAYALYPAPLRHGMTMGELAQLFAGELGIPVQLHVIPVAGWRRSMWWDETRLPWVVPSPAMVSPLSALLYPALVAFEGSNLSVGRGTDAPFQRVGAPWLDAPAVVELLRDRGLIGLRFEAERFTPREPTDGKFGGRTIPGVRIYVDDRDRAQMARLGASLFWAIAEVHRDSLRLTARSFDERFGTARVRESLLGGGDPDEVIDASLPSVVGWQQGTRQYLIYR
ncbi:MAG: DUF1343 domain-containing protein [Gemmatimonadaceae bacterium]|nr:DUF1343 domain-containing protein [Gemmatimonadaceae bacterium]MCW5825513.1 DUF1343 domain-containing protein [Gemmatimonadaceae bacterium]